MWTPPWTMQYCSTILGYDSLLLQFFCVLSDLQNKSPIFDIQHFILNRNLWDRTEMFIVIYIFIKFLSHKVEMSSRSQIKVYQCYLNRTCIRQGQAILSHFRHTFFGDFGRGYPQCFNFPYRRKGPPPLQLGKTYFFYLIYGVWKVF